MERKQEFDFAKGVLILLMVAFHLGHFHSLYPQLTKCVYAFHMPGFLVISGFFFNANKNIPSFLKTLKKIIVPYFIFEAIYLIGLNYLGALVGSSNSGGGVRDFLYHYLLSPVGTYWYLYTLAICMIINYVTNCFVKLRWQAFVVIVSFLIFLSFVIPNIKIDNVLFFMFGVLIHNMVKDNSTILSKGASLCLWSLVAFVFVAVFIPKYDNVFVKFILTISSLIFLLTLHNNIPFLASGINFIGRNSFSILLFSPFLTIATKFYIPLFNFDSTAIVWLMVSLLFIIVGCLFSAKILDIMKIPYILWGANLYIY